MLKGNRSKKKNTKKQKKNIADNMVELRSVTKHRLTKVKMSEKHGRKIFDVQR